MDNVSDILPSVLRKRGLQKHAAASLVVHHAQQWLFEHLPAFAEALSVEVFKDRSLFIEAKNSIAAQECNAVASDLKEHLQKTCGHTPLEEIVIKRETAG